MAEISYAIAAPADTPAVIRLLAQCFSESEPPAVAMKLSFADMQRFLQDIVPRIVPDQLTVVARDEDRDELAGVLLTDDFAAAVAIDLDQISPKFLPILSMLETLDSHFRAHTTVTRYECLHLFMLAVRRGFAGRGIAQDLVRRCLENGSRKGYRSAITEATGGVSQHVFAKCGFLEQFSVNYQQFFYRGEAVFASITEHEKASLMVRVFG